MPANTIEFIDILKTVFAFLGAFWTIKSIFDYFSKKHFIKKYIEPRQGLIERLIQDGQFEDAAEELKFNLHYLPHKIDLIKYFRKIRNHTAIFSRTGILTAQAENDYFYSIQKDTVAALNDAANISFSANQYEIALKKYTSIEKLINIDSQLVLSEKEKGIITNNIGNCYKELGLFVFAIDYYRKAREHLVAAKDAFDVCMIDNNIGYAQVLLSKYREGFLTLSAAIRSCIDEKNTRILSYALNNLGEAAIHLGKHKTAVKFILNSLNLNCELNDNYARPYILINLLECSIYCKSPDYRNKLASLINANKMEGNRILYDRFNNLSDRNAKKIVNGIEQELETALKLLV